MEEDKVEEGEKEQIVTPWEVAASKEGGRIDYDKLIVQFGCQKLDKSIVERVEKLTGKPAHVFLRRGVFFAHSTVQHLTATQHFAAAQDLQNSVSKCQLLAAMQQAGGTLHAHAMSEHLYAYRMLEVQPLHLQEEQSSLGHKMN
ncbi:hypothetical protein KI387_023515, partial [Taxus chinensis]